MVMDQLHPSGFVETGNSECVGPRLIRNQPNRESPGVLLSEKYIVGETPEKISVDFNLPFRNSIQNTNMLKMMYDKLDQSQKNIINEKISQIVNGSNFNDTDIDIDDIQNKSSKIEQFIEPKIKSLLYEPIGILGLFLILLCMYIFFNRNK